MASSSPSFMPPAPWSFTNSSSLCSRVGRVFKAHRLLYHSTLGSRVIKKKQKCRVVLSDLG